LLLACGLTVTVLAASLLKRGIWQAWGARVSSRAHTGQGVPVTASEVFTFFLLGAWLAGGLWMLWAAFGL